MSRDEYLQILRDNLTTMSDDDKDDVIRYYLEYFADAGAGQEQAVIQQLGRPEALADRLCGTNNFKGDSAYYAGMAEGLSTDYTRDTGYAQAPKKRHSAGKIALLICLSPLWLTLAILAFVAILVPVILVGTVFIVFAAFVFAGAVSVAAGIVVLFKSAANGLLVAGAGLMMVGSGIYLFFLGKLMAKALGKLVGAASHRLGRSAD